MKNKLFLALALTFGFLASIVINTDTASAEVPPRSGQELIDRVQARWWGNEPWFVTKVPPNGYQLHCPVNGCDITLSEQMCFHYDRDAGKIVEGRQGLDYDIVQTFGPDDRGVAIQIHPRSHVVAWGYQFSFYWFTCADNGGNVIPVEETVVLTNGAAPQQAPAANTGANAPAAGASECANVDPSVMGGSWTFQEGVRYTLNGQAQITGHPCFIVHTLPPYGSDPGLPVGVSVNTSVATAYRLNKPR